MANERKLKLKFNTTKVVFTVFTIENGVTNKEVKEETFLHRRTGKQIQNLLEAEHAKEKNTIVVVDKIVYNEKLSLIPLDVALAHSG